MTVLIGDYLLLQEQGTKNLRQRLRFTGIDGHLLLHTTTTTDITSERLVTQPVDFKLPDDQSGDRIEVPMNIARRIFGE